MPALALIELASLARGMVCLDALLKKAPVQILEANLVEPGHFLILFQGSVAAVQEAHQEALRRAEGERLDQVLLADPHPALLAGLRGATDTGGIDCLGIVEGQRVASTLLGCDRALKDAAVRLVGVRLAGALGGKGWYAVHGAQHDVQAALEVAAAVMGASVRSIACIARPHEEMLPWVLRIPPFQVR